MLVKPIGYKVMKVLLLPFFLNQTLLFQATPVFGVGRSAADPLGKKAFTV